MVFIPNFFATSIFSNVSSMNRHSSGFTLNFSQASKYIFGSGFLIPTLPELIYKSKIAKSNFSFQHFRAIELPLFITASLYCFLILGRISQSLLNFSNLEGIHGRAFLISSLFKLSFSLISMTSSPL